MEQKSPGRENQLNLLPGICSRALLFECIACRVLYNDPGLSGETAVEKRILVDHFKERSNKSIISSKEESK